MLHSGPVLVAPAKLQALSSRGGSWGPPVAQSGSGAARGRGSFRGCYPAPEKHRAASWDLATKGKGQCRRWGLSLGRVTARPPGPRPAPALTQRLRGALGLFPRFWTLRWIRPTSPFPAPLRAGSRAEGWGSQFPGPAPQPSPRAFPVPSHPSWALNDPPAAAGSTPAHEPPSTPEPRPPGR